MLNWLSSFLKIPIKFDMSPKKYNCISRYYYTGFHNWSNKSHCCWSNSWQTIKFHWGAYVNAQAEKTKEREEGSSQMFYSLLNLSVIAVRVASTQQSPGLLQGLLNGFTSSSHSAAHTKTLNTSLKSINNNTHSHTAASHTHPNMHTGPIRWHKTK